MVTVEEIIEEVRASIGDDDPDEEVFPDDKFYVFIRAALRDLAARAGISVQIESGEFTSAVSTEVANLISLKVQCLIFTRQFKEAVSKGVRVKQDENEVDTSAGLGGFQKAAMGEYSPCSLYENALDEYVSNIAGSVVYGENVWSGNSNLYEDVDHNGQWSRRIFKPGAGDHYPYRKNDTRFSHGDMP